MKRLIYISIILTSLSLNLKAQEIQLDSLVNVSFEGITLKQALNNLSEEYDISFSYSDSKIPVNDTIRAAYKLTRLGTVLKSLLFEHGINYNIIGKQIVLFPFNTNQTIVIRGKVINKSNGSPIPFASISLAGTSKGTSSNEDGEFQLALGKLPSELFISHLSHEKKLVYVYDDSDEIVIDLIPAQTTLQEITVTAKGNKKSNYQLVKKAYNLLSKSQSDVKYGKAFYRQKSSREDKYTEIFEMFYDVKYSSNGIEDWAVQEGRYAFQTDEEYAIFLYNKNFTLLSRLFPIQQPATDSYIIPVNPEVKKLFDLKLENVLKSDDRYIAVISFTPKISLQTPIASGEIYIDLDNHQVLKMKGTLIEEDLDMISLGENDSKWENNQLDFQVSFLDDQSGQLLMDFIRIDHHFDYYYQSKYIGKIKTSSLLTFYEHYSPTKNKKLGGPINFRKSDMDIIDGIGYNSAFWSKNPVVKRTPLEEELIQDFEENEAFGTVFLNNQDEVVLMPDKQNTAKVKQIISKFEAEHTFPEKQKLFLRMDKENYMIDDDLQFTAYILDRWWLKPYLYGSVLFVEIFDANGKVALRHKFDIKQGMSYGEIALSELSHPGIYKLKAHTNAQGNQAFQKSITISYSPTSASYKSGQFTDLVTAGTQIEFFAESGNLIHNVQSKVVFVARTNEDIPIKSNWELINRNGVVYNTINTNNLGYGSFYLAPIPGAKYFLRQQGSASGQQWRIPDGQSHGFSMKLLNTNSRSIQAELILKPAIPKELYLLSTASGKVFSFYEKQFQGSRAVIDLPLAHLPGGVNTLVAMDKLGNILARRSFFVQPEKLDIQLESTVWKSKRSNRVQINLKISDQNGTPVAANLNAICSSKEQNCNENCDIRNYLYFGDNSPLANIDLSLQNDSVFHLIDEILITHNRSQGMTNHSVNSASEDQATLNNPLARNDERVFAEISISSNYSSSSTSKAKNQTKQQLKNTNKNTAYWIPVLDIDEHGMAQIEYKLESKNKPFYLNIQGVSHFGQVGNQRIKINPQSITTKKKAD